MSLTTMSLQESNQLKLILVLIYTIPTVAFFAWEDRILWKPALYLAGGQLVGGFLAGWLNVRFKYINQLVEWTIIIMCITSILYIVLR